MRKLVRAAILGAVGRDLRFSVRRVGFQDLARVCAWFVRVKDGTSGAEQAALREAFRRLRTEDDYRVLLDLPDVLARAPGPSVRDHVRHRVYNRVFERVDECMDERVWDSVDSRVRRHVDERVWDRVRACVENR